MNDNATKHAMARRLQELLGIAQAESIIAGMKLQAAQQVGHHGLAALHADDRMWDAVVKALTPKEVQQQGQPSATPVSALQKPPTKSVATLEDIRATLVAQGQPNLAEMLRDGCSARTMNEAAAAIETTAWDGGTQAATMANVAVLLREMTKPAPTAIPGDGRDRLEFGGSSRLP
jgi:hypothetical protein